MAEKTILANFIIEILGRPPEHIIEALKDIIDKAGKEKGVKMINHKIHEPKELKENSDDVQSKLYTSFVEVEAEFESLENLLNISFNYMPSNFEIISPEEIVLKNERITEIITAINLRLHKYDEIAKKMVMDNKILESRLKEIVDAIKDRKQINIVDDKSSKEKSKNNKKK